MRIWLYSCTRFLESVSSAVKHCKLQLYTIQYFLVRRIRFLFVLQSTLSSNRFSDASKRHSSVPIPILNAQRTSLSHIHIHMPDIRHTLRVFGSQCACRCQRLSVLSLSATGLLTRIAPTHSLQL